MFEFAVIDSGKLVHSMDANGYSKELTYIAFLNHVRCVPLRFVQ